MHQITMAVFVPLWLITDIHVATGTCIPMCAPRQVENHAMVATIAGTVEKADVPSSRCSVFVR